MLKRRCIIGSWIFLPCLLLIPNMVFSLTTVCLGPNSDKREIRIEYSDQERSIPCKTYYTKYGQTKEIANAIYAADICERIYNDVISNLVASEYTCNTVLQDPTSQPVSDAGSDSIPNDKRTQSAGISSRTAAPPGNSQSREAELSLCLERFEGVIGPSVNCFKAAQNQVLQEIDMLSEDIFSLIRNIGSSKGRQAFQKAISGWQAQFTLDKDMSEMLIADLAGGSGSIVPSERYKLEMLEQRVEQLHSVIRLLNNTGYSLEQ